MDTAEQKSIYNDMGTPLFKECQLGTLEVMAMQRSGTWVISFNTYDVESGKYTSVVTTEVPELPATREELFELFVSELRKQIA